MDLTFVVQILEKQKLMSVGTQGANYPDNSIVCYAYDEACCLYFGSYSDTLKCKNIAYNDVVAITIGTLQIHGKAKLIPYGVSEYEEGRKIYDNRFPQYQNLFELENNELYKIEPLVIWHYSPSQGEMHRDVIILDEAYYQSIEVYKPHSYISRTKKEIE